MLGGVSGPFPPSLRQKEQEHLAMLRAAIDLTPEPQCPPKMIGACLACAPDSPVVKLRYAAGRWAVLRMYRKPLIRLHSSTPRLLQPRFACEISDARTAHTSPVRSLGYRSSPAFTIHPILLGPHARPPVTPTNICKSRKTRPFQEVFGEALRPA